MLIQDGCSPHGIEYIPWISCLLTQEQKTQQFCYLQSRPKGRTHRCIHNTLMCFEVLYFSPAIVISKALSKIKRDEKNGILVVLYWPNFAW